LLKFYDFSDLVLAVSNQNINTYGNTALCNANNPPKQWAAAAVTCGAALTLRRGTMRQ
jgi:hypothetical protein